MTDDPLEIAMADITTLNYEKDVLQRTNATLCQEVARLRRQLHISLELNQELIDIGRMLTDGTE